MSEPDAPPSRTGLADGDRKVIAQIFVSMDGVMQAPGGPEEDTESGFSLGGWSMSYWDESMGRALDELMAQPGELLLGRRTYDFFADYWPKHPDQMPGAKLNQVRKYVASRTKTQFEWENSRALSQDIVASVRELKQSGGPQLNVVGSSNFLQTLLKHDLVDELEIWVFPVVIGSGKRLFGDGAVPTAWKLIRCQSSGTGVLMQRYERAGPIVTGTPLGS